MTRAIARVTLLLKKNLRRIARRRQPGALILLYHRVAELSRDPFRLAVTPAHFAEHLDVLARRHRVISLENMLSCLDNGTLPPRAVVLTFDDGYQDIAQHAQPELAKHGMQATVFVTTGYVENREEPWWDQLEQLCFYPGSLPSELKMRFPEGEYLWQDSDPPGGRGDRPPADWNWYQSVDDDPRQVLFRGLYDHLKLSAPGRREAIMDRLFQWAGMQRTTRSSHRILSRDEIARLDSEGVVQIGAHTVTHPMLSVLSTPEQRTEIVGSKLYLQETVGHAVNTFAYPYGARPGNGTQTRDILVQGGFVGACSGQGGRTTRETDRLSLPRNEVWDCDGDAFERLLEDWWLR